MRLRTPPIAPLTAALIVGLVGVAQAGPGATTVPIPANKDVATQVELPPDTDKLNMKTGAGSFTCTNLQLVTKKGRTPGDQYFPRDPITIPAHLDSTQSHNTPGDPYVLVFIRCHGGATDSQLILTPMK